MSVGQRRPTRYGHISKGDPYLDNYVHLVHFQGISDTSIDHRFQRYTYFPFSRTPQVLSQILYFSPAQFTILITPGFNTSYSKPLYFITESFATTIIPFFNGFQIWLFKGWLLNSYYLPFFSIKRYTCKFLLFLTPSFLGLWRFVVWYFN